MIKRSLFVACLSLVAVATFAQEKIKDVRTIRTCISCVQMKWQVV